MSKNTVFRAALLAVVSQAAAFSAPAGPVPISALLQSASVIAVGTLTSADTDPNTGQPTLTINVIRALQGQPGAMSVVATAASADLRTVLLSIPSSFTGKAGVWFLAQNTGGYDILPVENGFMVPEDLFLPVTQALVTTAPSGTLEQQLLQYLVGWYESLPNPTTKDDMRCLAWLRTSSQQDVLAAANVLLGSPAIGAQVIGLTKAISLGSDDAIIALSNSANTIGTSPEFFLVRDALGTAYQPHGAASIPVLKQLIEQHSTAPGINASAASALAKIPLKQTLPVMAELLTDNDASAQARAETFFGRFTLFADKDGNLPDGGPSGPFATEATQRYTPRRNSGISAEEYSIFWQQWWQQNRARLGL